VEIVRLSVPFTDIEATNLRRLAAAVGLSSSEAVRVLVATAQDEPKMLTADRVNRILGRRKAKGANDGCNVHAR
jgi:hypothetical protein